MEFTFNFNTDLCDVAYNTGVAVTNNTFATLDAWIAAGVAFKGESPKHVKEYARYAVQHPEVDMTADSYGKRLGEAIKLARKFDTVEGVEAAVNAYNDQRETDGQKRSGSLQIIAAGICGKGHKADKKVAAEAVQDEVNDDVSAPKGSVLQSILAMLQSNELTAEDRIIIAMANEHAANGQSVTLVEA